MNFDWQRVFYRMVCFRAFELCWTAALNRSLEHWWATGIQRDLIAVVCRCHCCRTQSENSIHYYYSDRHNLVTAWKSPSMSANGTRMLLLIQSVEWVILIYHLSKVLHLPPVVQCPRSKEIGSRLIWIGGTVANERLIEYISKLYTSSVGRQLWRRPETCISLLKHSGCWCHMPWIHCSSKCSTDTACSIT